MSLLRPTRPGRTVPAPPPAEVDSPADPVEQAEIQRQLDAVKERIDAARRPDPPAVERGSELPRTLRDGPPPSMGELVAAEVARVLADQDRERVEREHRQAEAAAVEERAQREALMRGGPCRYCGVTLSWLVDDHGQRLGRWFHDVCAWCNNERDTFNSSDGEHREVVLRGSPPRLAGLLPESVTTYEVYGSLAAKTGFRWWSETPGAIATETEPFAYVDVDALVARLEPPPTRYETREPCQRCGCVDRWFSATGYMASGVSHIPLERWVCSGCQHAGDLLALTARVTKLLPWSVESLGDAAALVLGVTWWSDAASGGKADPARPCTEPFGYLDLAAARRRAWELFGSSERSWATPDVYRKAAAAAREVRR